MIFFVLALMMMLTSLPNTFQFRVIYPSSRLLNTIQILIWLDRLYIPFIRISQIAARYNIKENGSIENIFY